MRFLPGLLLLLCGCGDLMPDLYKDNQEMKSFGQTPEDLDAPPGPNAIRARVISDAHQYRILQARLDEGKPTCPEPGLKYEKDVPLCATDGDPVEVVHFPEEARDKPNRWEETAYYCHKEKIYYYHYVGGREKKDVWLGPFKLPWARAQKD